MDLFERAGIDISDWANYERGATNPAANPKYCYEWALKQPNSVLVCNLWFGNMREINGEIEQHLQLADSATNRETNATRRSRRTRLVELLAEAYKEELPIRVIILDGQTRESSQKGRTRVTGRSLDSAVWSVVSVDENSTTFIVRRGLPPLHYVDQFDLPPPHDGPGTISSRTVTLRERSGEIRAYALRRAKGNCEFCGVRGFEFPDGRVYLETHHIVPLSQGGADSASNVAALCANHHREAHHGREAVEIARKLQAKLASDN